MEEAMSQKNTVAIEVISDLAPFIQVLARLYKEGRVSLASLRRYLANPGVVFAVTDELILARQVFTAKTHIQELVCGLADIAAVTRNPLDLERVVEEAASLPEGPSTPGETYIATSRAYLSCGNIQEALRIARLIPDSSSRARALLQIFKESNLYEILEEARRCTQSTQRLDEKFRCCGLVAAMSGESGDLQLATEVRDAFARNADSARAVAWLQLPLIRAFSEAGELVRARALAASAQLSEARVAAWAIIVQHSGEVDDLRTLLKEAQACPKLRVKGLHFLVASFAKCGKLNAARQFAKSRPHATERCILFAEIAASQGGMSTDLDEAVHTYEKIATPAVDTARLCLVQALVHHNEFSRARRVAEQVGTLRLKCRAYLAIHQARVGDQPGDLEEDWS
ncbi:hypothetical protein HYW17_02420 [Candidatus Uhrbacteria bacterium]|nr:hypothetical protein [Candidatus Uhrbacteria bacterium]